MPSAWTVQSVAGAKSAMRPIAGPASFPETTTTSSMQQTVAVAPQFREAPIAMIRPTMERRGLPAITLAPDRHTQEALRALRLFHGPTAIRASDSLSEAPARPEKVLVRKGRQRLGARAARKEPKRRRGWHLLPPFWKPAGSIAREYASQGRCKLLLGAIAL